MPPPPSHSPSASAPFIAIALIALLVSCQSPSKPLELEETQFSLIPKGSEQARAKEAKNGRKSPYSCLISTLADDEADYNYWNRAFWLEFPEKVIKEANGKVVMRAIALGSEHAGSKAGSWQGVDNVVRVAQCLIPDSPLAVELLEAELRKFSEGTWISSKRGKIASPSTSGWECSEFFIVVSCWGTPTSYYCEVTDVRCTSYIYIDEEPIGGGGGDGFPGEDPGECDPYGAEPCYLGGGGSQPPPDPPNPCLESNPPAYCSNPCDTDDIIIDHIGTQIVLEDLIEKSRFDLPLSQRLEQGGFFTYDESTGQRGFVEFPPSWPRFACGIELPESWKDFIPSNTVGWVHTHPFYVGENTTGSDVCGEEGESSYTSKHSSYDFQALLEIIQHTGRPTIKGYVVDGNNITVFNVFTPIVPEAIHERCGS